MARLMFDGRGVTDGTGELVERGGGGLVDMNLFRLVGVYKRIKKKKEAGYLKMLIAVDSCIDSLLLIYMTLWSCFLKISVALVFVSQ